MREDDECKIWFSRFICLILECVSVFERTSRMRFICLVGSRPDFYKENILNINFLALSKHEFEWCDLYDLF